MGLPVDAASAGLDTATPDPLDELIDFLGSARVELASGAADAALGLSSTTNGAQTLLARADVLLPALLRLATGPPAPPTDPALGALVNLSHDPAAAASLRGLAAIPRLMDALRDEDGGGGADGDASLRSERRLGLLSNLTADEEGAAALVGGGGGGGDARPSAAGIANLARLLGAFLGGDPATDPVAPLLTNLTRSPAGRALLLDAGGEGGLAGGLAAAAGQLEAPGASPGRRAGCAAALRNCCLAAAQAQGDEREEGEEEGGEAGGGAGAAAAANLAAGTAAMGAVLTPAVLRPALTALCGGVAALDPEAEAGAAPTRPPDPEEGVREAVAEAVLLLAGTAPGRAALWDVGAPEALRLAYVDEEGPYVCEAMEKTARLFLENAGGVEEVEEEDGQSGGRS